MGRQFRLTSEVAAAIAGAEAALLRLDLNVTRLVDTEVLARVLLRAEAVASSRIEGLEVGARCLDAGILRQVTVGRRNRAYEAPDVIAAFTALERSLASPDGDTRSSEPVRPVPRGVS